MALRIIAIVIQSLFIIAAVYFLVQAGRALTNKKK